MRVFFIGICGTAMGNAAVLLKKQGHEVAGSDLGVYPPMSDVLSASGIELFEGGHHLWELILLRELQGQRVACGHHRHADCRANRQEKAETAPAQSAKTTKRKVHSYQLSSALTKTGITSPSGGLKGSTVASEPTFYAIYDADG